LSDGTLTEPDENTYLVLDHNPGGPTARYDYGRHFLIQGHENGGGMAYLTRINLDISDPAHRITLLSPLVGAATSTGFSSIDGSTWNPFSRTMLFTQEAGASGGVLETPLDWSSTTAPAVRNLDCAIGKGGFEGIHPDDEGNLWISEDVGGTGVSVDPTNINGSPKTAKQPNSFICKFTPYNIRNLGGGGRLYALQVTVDGAPLVFGGTTAIQQFAGVYSIEQKDLRDGRSWPAQWVLVHDSGVISGQCSAFDANAAAKKAGATPFKRPENGVFVPGTNFQSFVFDETGDTDATSGNVPALAERGAWGSFFRVDFPPGNSIGSLRIVVTGDANHASFDNVTFATGQTFLATEDRGDGLHDQLNLLDSVWAYDLSVPNDPGRRLIALGRDVVAAPNGAEDNEPTGLHVSEGGTAIDDLQGTAVPDTKAVHEHQIDPITGSVPPGLERARWFVTEQHGQNQVFEIFLVK